MGVFRGGVTENLKFRSPGVDSKNSAKVIPLVHLSPLLTVRKELVWIVLYSLVNILKINPWYFSPLSLLCYKGNHKEITREMCILTEKY